MLMIGTSSLDLGGAMKLGLHALQRVGARGALVAAHLVLGLGQHHHAAGLNMTL
jgi:hypothetical protein